ncbi:MAG: heavy metal-binding domain-containing protein [Exilibacterium sp.]
MLITTQDEFADYDIIETIGLVRGNTIRARHIGKDILAGLRTIIGGEISEYTKMLAESRENYAALRFVQEYGVIYPID